MDPTKARGSASRTSNWPRSAGCTGTTTTGCTATSTTGRPQGSRRPTLPNKPTSNWLESNKPSLHQTQCRIRSQMTSFQELHWPKPSPSPCLTGSSTAPPVSPTSVVTSSSTYDESSPTPSELGLPPLCTRLRDASMASRDRWPTREKARRDGPRLNECPQLFTPVVTLIRPSASSAAISQVAVVASQQWPDE